MRVIHSRRPPTSVEKGFAQLPIGDGRWQGRRASRHPADTNIAPRLRCCRNQQRYVYRESFDRGMRFVSKTNTQMSSGTQTLL